MRKINFNKIASSEIDKIYFVLDYVGGDADTQHPEYVLLPFPFSQWKNNLDLIEKNYNFYKEIKSALDNGGLHSKNYIKIKEEYGDDVYNFLDEVPNDPQADYQFKCSLHDIYLIGYDNEGNKFKSYL